MYKKLIQLIKNNYLLISILLIGLVLRTYKAKELLAYAHDQDVAGWIIKDIVVNRHIRLIGQETSVQGIFIGALYYYILVPFYLIFNMDPVGGIILATLLGLFSIWSFYFVFSRVFDRTTGLVAAFVYSVSFFMVYNDRGVLPTTPVILWSVWYLYALNLLLKGKQQLSFILLGILIGLIWHLNATLFLLTALIPLAWWLSRKKINRKALLKGFVVMLIANLPLVAFEVRHNFPQIRGVYNSFSADQGSAYEGVAQLWRVMHIFFQNVTTLVFQPPQQYFFIIPSILFVAFLAFVKSKIISRKLGIVLLFWSAIVLVFFSLYSKTVSEYYLHGIIIVWFLVLVLIFSYLIKSIKYKALGVLILVLYTFLNIQRFSNYPTNKNGYVERRAVVAEIKKDAASNDYPCVSVSYLTDPGYDLGYRYLYWLENMHVEKPSSGAPVYSIVLPLKPYYEVHKTFGNIGLIYPDYGRYTNEQILRACEGENANLTEPFFGYTE